jgi:hypothetical protein
LDVAISRILLVFAAALALPSCLERDPDFIRPGDGETGNTTDPADTGTDAGTGDGTGAGTDTGPMCDASETECQGECFDLQSDKNHCGSCDNKCMGSSKCVDGACS